MAGNPALITLLIKMIYDLKNVVIEMIGLYDLIRWHGGIVEQAENGAR